MAKKHGDRRGVYAFVLSENRVERRGSCVDLAASVRACAMSDKVTRITFRLSPCYMSPCYMTKSSCFAAAKKGYLTPFRLTPFRPPARTITMKNARKVARTCSVGPRLSVAIRGGKVDVIAIRRKACSEDWEL